VNVPADKIVSNGDTISATYSYTLT
jgi:hypothetical protein